MILHHSVLVRSDRLQIVMGKRELVSSAETSRVQGK